MFGNGLSKCLRFVWEPINQKWYTKYIFYHSHFIQQQNKERVLYKLPFALCSDDFLTVHIFCYCFLTTENHVVMYATKNYPISFVACP